MIVKKTDFSRGKENDSGEARVYPGKLEVSEDFCTIPVTIDTTVADLIKEALVRFNLDYRYDELRCSEVLLDRGGSFVSTSAKASLIFFVKILSSYGTCAVMERKTVGNHEKPGKRQHKADGVDAVLLGTEKRSSRA